jgi:hypothetical protein
LGVDVRSALTRAETKDIGAYTQTGVTTLIATGILHGALRVPNAAAPFDITADLRSGLITCSIGVDAPLQGRNATRVNWLTRQLGKAPDALLVEAWAAWARSPGPCHTITSVREKPEILLDDPKKELRSFTVRLSAVAGTKRGQGRGSFVGSVLALVDSFYENVVQHIKPWTPPAPTVKTRQSGEESTGSDDGISGELPLKSVQRAAPVPEWQPDTPSEAREPAIVDPLQYAISADDLADMQNESPPPGNGDDGSGSERTGDGSLAVSQPSLNGPPDEHSTEPAAMSAFK